MSEAAQIASMGITNLIELMQARNEIKALKEALAKQEQGEPVGDWVSDKEYWEAPKQENNEPVGYITNKRQRLNVELKPNAIVWMPTTTDWELPIYTHPQPKREPLTDEEIVAINDKHYNIAYRDFDADIAIARAIEAAHGIKGEA